MDDNNFQNSLCITSMKQKLSGPTEAHGPFIVQVFVVSLPCMYLFLFLGMLKVETSPLTPVRSKEVWLLPLFLDGFRYSLRCINKGDSAKGGNKFWEGIPDVPFNPRSCFSR